MFEIANFKIFEIPPSSFDKEVRYWDLAGTDGGGMYTVGVKMLRLKGNSWNIHYFVDDVVRFQYSAGKRNYKIKETAELDGTNTKIVIEQEPGSSGQDVILDMTTYLDKFYVVGDRVTGSKVDRAGIFASKVESGIVGIRKAPWNKDFLEEFRVFPEGKFKDQVDATCGSYTHISKSRKIGVW
jgi:predicted phage terminase large subunit-like protein